MNNLELDRRLVGQRDSQTPFAAIEAMCEQASAEYLVWWGCLCGWSTWRPVPPASEDPSLSIASRWVFTADDTLRQAAAVRAEMPSAGSCKWLLKAIAHSGRSIAPHGQVADMPTPDATGRFILGFIHQLLATHSTVNRAAVAEAFVQLARQALMEPLPRLATPRGSQADHG